MTRFENFKTRFSSLVAVCIIHAADRTNYCSFVILLPPCCFHFMIINLFWSFPLLNAKNTHQQYKKQQWIKKSANDNLVAFLLPNPVSELVNPDCLDFRLSWNENLKKRLSNNDKGLENPTPFLKTIHKGGELLKSAQCERYWRNVFMSLMK